MNKRALGAILSIILLFQPISLLYAAQNPQQSWFGNIVSGGIDLVKQGVALGMFSALMYKAQEYEMQKEAAEAKIAQLQKKLQENITGEDKAAINDQIKQQEAIRDQKKTIGQKAAQAALGVMGTLSVGAIAWTLWDPYLTKTNQLLDKYCGKKCSISIGGSKIFELTR